MICTRCENTGFLNLEQVDEVTLQRFNDTGDPQVILDWIEANVGHDVVPCDCCGNGDAWGWYGIPGLHDLNNPEEPFPDCY